MALAQPEILNTLVGRVFRYEDITLGDQQRGYLVRYHGQLLLDSAEAYDRLAEALRPYEVTPLFRIEDGRQTVMLVQGVPHPKPGRIRTNVLLFALTVVSVLFVGTLSSYQGPVPSDPVGQITTLLLHLWIGWPFAVSLLGILLAHEFGHYFAGRYHKTAVSLPYFLPLPVPPLGTMGAFIQMKERPRNTRILFDIGVAGPLAGLVVAVPVLILGLALSKVAPIQDTAYVKTPGQPDACTNTAGLGQTYTCPTEDAMEGTSPLYLALKYLVKGRLLPAPAQYDIAPAAYWLRYMFTGHPIPIGGLDVMLHPVALAGWAGLLVTFLNLIPAGQLDGGHVLFSVFGKHVNRVLPVILVVTALLGFFWSGWWLWTFLIFFLGRTHAETLDQITPLDPRRKAVAVLMLVIFLLVFTPVPFTVF
jgi:membrane-associated protease RseP (regulator of RpoE activity)